MRKSILTLNLIFISALRLFAGVNQYAVTIDLTNVVNDRVKVVVNVPPVQSDEVVYCLPKMVPGTYSIYDFGRFVIDIKAFDTNGNTLVITPKSVNEFQINNASELSRLEYWVEDTYDMTMENVIFEPSGTNIEEGQNFIVNNFGFAGYIEGMKNVPYELTIKHPDNFYGSTALIDTKNDLHTDTYLLSGYDNLADSPLLYAIADTAIKKVGGADVLIGIYSPNHKLTARQIMNEVSEVLEAQEKYLGGKLPVQKYAFLIYFTDTAGVSGGMGALEHNNSSVYFLPEDSIQNIASFLRDVCAHEFFHIVTPLNIHSEEIGDFNFIEPEMSEHLWLYEGQTEYAAHHAQVKAGLITLDEFLSRMQGKIENSRAYYIDTLPFTVMSKGCLDIYKNEYTNVYQKGALINMCLDIELRRLSKGKYGTQDLMKDLAKYYGKDKSFKDEELFDRIAALTYPEIRTFFATYVEGDKPIPYDKFFATMGIVTAPSTIEKRITLGNISLNYDFREDEKRITILSLVGSNAFAREMGYKEGDQLISINGKSLTTGDPNATIDNWKALTKPGDKVVILVEREVKGKIKQVKLKGKAMQIDVEIPGQLTVSSSATPEQIALRKAWVNQ